MLWKKDQSPGVKKERKPSLRGKRECVFSGMHTDKVPKDTHAFSVMTQRPLATVAKVRDKGRSSSPASHSKANRLTVRDKHLAGIRQ